MKKRPLVFWLVGTVFIYLSIFFISGAMSSTVGETGAAILFGNLMGFVFLLVGGMFWISIMHIK